MRLLSHPRFTLDLCAAEKQKFSGGTGTAADPYLIADYDDLIELKADLMTGTGITYAGKFFKQTDDIDLDGKAWSPMCQTAPGAAHGLVDGVFCGTYDGDGHAIKNMTVTIPKYGAAFMSEARDATFKNLTIHIAATPSSVGGGAFVGNPDNCTFIGCTAQGTISGTHHLGGFTCYGQWADGAVYFIDCTNEATVVTTSKGCAGFAGNAQDGASFVRCVNKGSVTFADGTGAAFTTGKATYEDCLNLGAAVSDQFYKPTDEFGGSTYGRTWAVTPLAGANKGVLTVRTYSSAFDGINFADLSTKETIESVEVATLVSNSQVVVGGSYKVMSPIATLPITLDTVGQTIAFDVALNTAFKATITADGVGVTTNLAENVLTYTAIEAPTPGEDWPTDPTVDEGKDAKATFPNLPATFEGADAGLVAAWAKKTGLAYADMATADIDAFLLDCAPADVDTEKAKFVITSIAFNGEKWVVTVANEFDEGERYGNGQVAIDDVTATFDADATKATDAKGFFKAKLVKFIVTK